MFSAPVIGLEPDDEVLTNLKGSYIGADGGEQRRTRAGWAGGCRSPRSSIVPPMVNRGHLLALLAAPWAITIAGCVNGAADSYPLLTRFPDPPKVLSAAEWQQIREALVADRESGAAERVEDRPPSTR